MLITESESAWSTENENVANVRMPREDPIAFFKNHGAIACTKYHYSVPMTYEEVECVINLSADQKSLIFYNVDQ